MYIAKKGASKDKRNFLISRFLKLKPKGLNHTLIYLYQITRKIYAKKLILGFANIKELLNGNKTGLSFLFLPSAW